MSDSLLVIEGRHADAPSFAGELQKKGFEVHAESSVIRANRHLFRSRIDLVLLDVQMPMISGAEVCRILKSREETQAVPVLFCSDLPEEELQRLVEEAGAEGYVSKARPLPELVAEVKRRLR